MSRDRYFM